MHSFHRGARDRVVVPVLGCPGSRPLMTRIPLILRQVFTKLSLIGIVSEQLVPHQCERKWMLCIDNLIVIISVNSFTTITETIPGSSAS